jgi:hypothetical protein
MATVVIVARVAMVIVVVIVVIVARAARPPPTDHTINRAFKRMQRSHLAPLHAFEGAPPPPQRQRRWTSVHRRCR